MNTIITLTTVQLVSIALGAAAAFIIDMFFIASLNHSKLRPKEVLMVRRLSLLSISAAIIALFIQTLILFIIPATIPDQFLTFSFVTILFTIAALVCSMTLRRVHIPALIRHQNQHAHLSEHHMYHGEEIVLVSTISTVSWLTVIVIYAVAQIGEYSSPYPFIIGYIIFVVIMSWLTRVIKRHLLDSRKHKKA
ncbi:MAG: hypothetical protein WCQ00_03795 [bacterium]